MSHLCRNDYTTAIWNLVPGDWRKPYSWVADCLAALNNANWPVVVLHDIVDGCLGRLPDFLTRLADLGISVEQDFPDSVIVMRKGRFVTLSRDLVSIWSATQGVIRPDGTGLVSDALVLALQVGLLKEEFPS